MKGVNRIAQCPQKQLSNNGQLIGAFHWVLREATCLCNQQFAAWFPGLHLRPGIQMKMLGPLLLANVIGVWRVTLNAF